jgi:hypothetical protein
VNQTVNGAYQILVDATNAIYFLSLLYMYAAAIKLAYAKDRGTNAATVLIPGGKFGVWVASSLGFSVVGAGIALSLIPPGEATNKWLFEIELVACIVLSIAAGLILYYRGVRAKSRNSLAATAPARQ